MIKKLSSPVSPKIISLIFGILVLCFVCGFYAVAWTEPTLTPPNGNVPPPVNTGSTTQTKGGTFQANMLSVTNGGVLALGRNISDPASGGTPGYMYYNDPTNTFRCSGAGGVWANCGGTAGSPLIYQSLDIVNNIARTVNGVGLGGGWSTWTSVISQAVVVPAGSPKNFLVNFSMNYASSSNCGSTNSSEVGLFLSTDLVNPIYKMSVTNTHNDPLSFQYVAQNLATGTYTYVIQWRSGLFMAGCNISMNSFNRLYNIVEIR